MSRTPWSQQLLRNRQHAPLGHARPAERAGVLQHQHRIGRHRQRRIVDARGEVVVVPEHDGRARVLQEPPLGRGVLDHGAARREIAAKNRHTPFRPQRPFARRDDLVIAHNRTVDVLADGEPVDRRAVGMQQIAQSRQDAAQPACVIEVLHEELSARADVAEERRAAGQRIEPIEIEVGAGTARHRDQVNDGIGRAASAIAAVTAFSNASVVRISRGVRFSQTMSTIRRPLATAIRECAESAAGIEDAPGSVRPSASTAAAIVDAVPIVMHVPKDRAMPSSISRQLHSSSVPARRSAQYFQTSLPDPRN